MKLTIRPATAADVAAIHDVVIECERHFGGMVDTTVDAIAGDLSRPALDLQHDTRAVMNSAGRLVAWAWVHLGRRAQVGVRPECAGRGIGTQLLAWTEERSRELGSARLGQNVRDDDTAAIGLLSRHGYEAKAACWLLEMPLSSEPSPATPPAGIILRSFRHGNERTDARDPGGPPSGPMSDAHQTYELIEDAFSSWKQRRRSFAEWSATSINRETFAPDLTSLAFDGDQLVGAALAMDHPGLNRGYLDELAVHHDYRGRGVARALIHRTFGNAYRLGRGSCALWTHSDTGALALYQRLGMTVRLSATHLSASLTGR